MRCTQKGEVSEKRTDILGRRSRNNISIEMMHEMKSKGLRLSIDDFGTDYSSFR